MNVLLSSAGRRSYLVEYFKEAIEGDGFVVATNSIANTTAMKVADKAYVIPHVYEDNYMDSILEICKNENIDYLFSLHDLEGPVLARNIDKLKAIGVKPIVSDLSVIETCLDKYASYKFLKINEIDTPKTWLSPEDVLKNKEYPFPFILKFRFGFGSINHIYVNNKEELLFAFNYLEARKNKKILHYLGVNYNESTTVIQEILQGEEYGIELINNLNKELVVQYHKHKLGMRVGETDSAKIIKDARLTKTGKKLAKSLKHIGILDCDVFFKDEKPYILEMNPRFGGQYPFTHLAGANVPKLILSDFKNPVLELRIGATFLKNITMVEI